MSSSADSIDILPRGLHRIRHYGLFASTGRADNIARARELLGVPKPQSDAPDALPLEQPLTLAHPCPCCGGRMIIIETFERGCSPRYRERRRPPRSGSTPHDDQARVPTPQICSSFSLVFHWPRSRSPERRAWVSKSRPDRHRLPWLDTAKVTSSAAPMLLIIALDPNGSNSAPHAKRPNRHKACSNAIVSLPASFPPLRFSNADPSLGVRGAARHRPASENLHNSGHSLSLQYSGHSLSLQYRSLGPILSKKSEYRLGSIFSAPWARFSDADAGGLIIYPRQTQRSEF